MQTIPLFLKRSVHKVITHCLPHSKKHYVTRDRERERRGRKRSEREKEKGKKKRNFTVIQTEPLELFVCAQSNQV